MKHPRTVAPPATRTRLRIIGVPLDMGAGRRGVDMGPSAVRIAGLQRQAEELGYKVSDDGDVVIPAPETRKPGNPKAKYLKEITKVCDQLRRRVKKALRAGWSPIVLGGDHSMAIGTVSGLAEFHRERDESIGLIWVDAHADMNTPDTTLSGNIHGMPLSALLGMGASELVEMGGFAPKVKAQNVVLIGIRNLDDAEKRIVAASGIHAYTMRDLDEKGMRTVMNEALRAANQGTAGFHLSFDADGLDPAVAPGVGTPVRGGVEWREAQLLMEMAHDSGRVLGLEFAEVNPILDVRNQTAEVAVELLLSALGKSIL